jgi:hypothetical protein
VAPSSDEKRSEASPDVAPARTGKRAGETLPESAVKPIRLQFDTIEIHDSLPPLGLASIAPYLTLVTNGAGILAGDPLFVTPAGQDYHLSAGCQCIDTGDPASVPLPGESDLDGKPRMVGLAVDMGCNEP